MLSHLMEKDPQFPGQTKDMSPITAQPDKQSRDQK